MTQLIWLRPEFDHFPDTKLALSEPNGLLAAGGNLSSRTLRLAYAKGIFPWFSDDDPILWWSPAPRMVAMVGNPHISRSFKRWFRVQENPIEIRCNHQFSMVIDQCQNREEGTWITEDIKKAYQQAHAEKFAHSIEVYQNQELIGGMYGICIGGMFFGESMFSKKSNGSKCAFYAVHWILKAQNVLFFDCQVYNHHLASLGCVEISRDQFEHQLTITQHQPDLQFPEKFTLSLDKLV